MHRSGAAKRRDGGFTLIELMVAVVIIGILAAIAIPSYTQHVIKARRAAAESFILQVANKQEQYILDTRSYATTLSALGVTVPNDVVGYYNISGAAGNPAIVTTGTPPGYTISAVPTGSQATGDTACATVTIDQTGTKGITGTSSVANCW